MTIDEFIEKLKVCQAEIEKQMLDISEEVAVNAIALVVNRIQQEGLPSKATYSKKKVPAFLLLLGDGGSKLDTEQTRVFVRSKAKKGEEINWEDVRRAHGNQTSFVDLTFTGRMWQNTSVIETLRTGDIYTSIIGGLNAEVNNKLKWNAARYGNFLSLTEEEENILKTIVVNRIQSIIEKTFS